MAKEVYKDSDILNAMEALLNEDAVVYGANGHYGVGAYYDITKVNSVFNESFDYNTDGASEASGTTAANDYYEDIKLKDANWMKEY